MLHPSLFTIIALTLTAPLLAQQPSIFPAAVNTPHTHHDGEIWLTFLAAATETFPYNLTVANSAPGTRLDWHSHPEGQRLVVTEGRGYYQERGKPARVMRPGMVFECPPDVEHFHAASPDQGVVYLAIYPEAPTQWGAPVTDEEYAAVPAQDSAARTDELLARSAKTWTWMADRAADSLAAVLHDEVAVVHPGGVWRRRRVLDAVEAGELRYARVDGHEATVALLGDDTAVLLDHVERRAATGGDDVADTYTAAATYERVGGTWQLASLSFARVGDE